MRLSPVAWFGSLVAGATGAGVALIVLGSGHSAPQQPTYVLHQDAQTGVAVITSAAPTTTAAAPVAPKTVTPASTVVVKQQSTVQQQEASVVTDPTSNDPAPAPSDTSVAAGPTASYPPPKGNPVGSTEYNPYVSPPPTEVHS